MEILSLNCPYIVYGYMYWRRYVHVAIIFHLLQSISVPVSQHTVWSSYFGSKITEICPTIIICGWSKYFGPCRAESI